MTQFKWLLPSQFNYENLVDEYWLILTPSGYYDPNFTDVPSGTIEPTQLILI